MIVYVVEKWTPSGWMEIHSIWSTEEAAEAAKVTIRPGQWVEIHEHRVCD